MRKNAGSVSIVPAMTVGDRRRWRVAVDEG
jgi:hypothetical protein